MIAFVAGGLFSAQAQDTISFFSFKSSESVTFGDLGHAFSEDYSHCNDNVIDASDIDVYSWDNSTGVLSFNGNTVATYTGFAKNAINGAFSRSENSLLSRNRFGGITGVLATGDGDSLTKP